MKHTWAFFIAIAFSNSLPASWAQETDQFCTPPHALEDVGPVLQKQVIAFIQEGLTEASRKKTNPTAFEITNIVADRLQSPFQTLIVTWAKELEKELGRTISFWPALEDGVLFDVRAPVPFTFHFAAPTVNIFSVYLGLDKLDHFFRHGAMYYQAYLEALAKGKSEEQAVRMAIKLGVRQEYVGYGFGVSGVYSNGDLAANFAGFLFLRNLTESVEIDGKSLPPMLLKNSQGEWHMNSHLHDSPFLEHFFTDHQNEALNPSIYLMDLDIIRAGIKRKCASFLNFYGFNSKDAFEKKSTSLRSWGKYDYGFLSPDPEVSIRSECF